MHRRGDSPWRSRCQGVLTAILAWLVATTAPAAPFVPAEDDLVLERLPRVAVGLGTGQQAAADVGRGALSAAIARAGDLIAAGRAEGDPRYLGYAQGVLAPWWDETDPPASVRLLRARIRQARHDFAGALEDLDAVLAARPGDAHAWLLKAGIEQVQGNLAAARRSCAALHRRMAPLVVATCASRVDALTGAAGRGYRRLQGALWRAPSADPAVMQWSLGTLAELAAALGDADAAERHYREALAAGGRDVGLLARYADFLLDRGRPAEVLALLDGETRADGLLLRLALAERVTGSPAFRDHRAELAVRFEAARQRGLRAHLREAARAALHLADRPREALMLALDGWSIHREPADARIVLEAALAAGQSRAARPVAQWVQANGTEGEPLRALVGAVLGKGAP